MNAHRLIPNRKPLFLRKGRFHRGPVAHATPIGMTKGQYPSIEHTKGQPAVVKRCVCGREFIGDRLTCSACDSRIGVVIGQRPEVSA